MSLGKLSRDIKQSSTSFVVSFFIHVALIIACSLFLLEYAGQNQITLLADAEDELIDLVTFDLPDESNIDIETGLFESTHVELKSINQLESPFDSLPLDETELDGVPFQIAPALVASDLTAELPEQGNSKFFGIEATGNRIVYIIDMSISMRHRSYHGSRYDRAVAEVMTSVQQLGPEQAFYVYLFCFDMYEMNIGQSTGTFCTPTVENKEKLRNWLNSVRLGSGTDPRESLVQALGQKPSCVFLLSDGEFNGVRYNNGRFGKTKTAVRIAEEFNVSDCPIHTIGLEDKANQRKMTAIAEESGGTYRFVSARDP